VTFTWYLSPPERGGETLVSRRRWDPDDERHRDGCGYAQSIVEGKPVAVMRPVAGDAAVFDSRNFHVVRKSEERVRRVSARSSLA
jgi:hypothetical protein